MIAKGRDCTNLFPAVVKNVVSKNPEVSPLLHIHVHVLYIHFKLLRKYFLPTPYFTVDIYLFIFLYF